MKRTERSIFRAKIVCAAHDIRTYSVDLFAIRLWYIIPLVASTSTGGKGLKQQLVKAVYPLLVLLQQNIKH